MNRMLIADRSELFAEELKTRFCDKYEVTICFNGPDALRLIRDQRPDILILHLSLPQMDGLSVIRQTPESIKPAIIIGVTDFISNIVSHTAAAMGFSAMMVSSYDVENLVTLVHTLTSREASFSNNITGRKLLKISLDLSLPSSTVCNEQLLYGISLFAKDPGQSLSKMLYPAVAEKFNTSASCVEYNMRSAIATAWKSGNKEMWNSYFPCAVKAPSVKVFLSGIYRFIAD